MDENAIIKKLIEHDQKFDAIERKIEQSIGDLRNEMLTGQDEILTILRRLDQERVTTYSWIKRVEAKGIRNTADITEIKRFLKMN